MLQEGDCDGFVPEEADAIIFAGWMEGGRLGFREAREAPLTKQFSRVAPFFFCRSAHENQNGGGSRLDLREALSARHSRLYSK